MDPSGVRFPTLKSASPNRVGSRRRNQFGGTPGGPLVRSQPRVVQLAHEYVFSGDESLITRH
jgi:hypothetical protein